MLKNIPAHLEKSLELFGYIQDAAWMLYPYAHLFLSKKPSASLSIQSRTQHTTTWSTQCDVPWHVLHLWRPHIPSIESLPMHLGFSTSGIFATLFMDKLESALSHTASSAHTRDMQMTSSFNQPMTKRQTNSTTPWTTDLHPRLKSEIKRPTFSLAPW